MKNKQRKCEFSLSISEDTRLIELLYNSLIVEAENSQKSKIFEHSPADRSEIEIQEDLDEESLQLKIRSDNIVSLRANINTWLRLIKVVDDISKIF